jgi:hypothetical protein
MAVLLAGAVLYQWTSRRRARDGAMVEATWPRIRLCTVAVAVTVAVVTPRSRCYIAIADYTEYIQYNTVGWIK